MLLIKIETFWRMETKMILENTQGDDYFRVNPKQSFERKAHSQIGVWK